MKQIITALLLLSVISLQAQKPSIPADVTGKPFQTIYPAGAINVPCSGFINPPKGDMLWKPLLQKKDIEIDHAAPNEQMLDSLDSVFYNLKMQKRTPGKGAQKTTGLYPLVGKSFAGNTHNGSSPQDDNLAISNGGIIVSLANSSIYYFDTFGTASYYADLVSFVGNPAITSLCDPAIVYDPVYDRFIFYCQQSNIQAGNKIVLCFSKDNNPNHGWWKYEMVGDPTTGTYLFDYPRIAINDSELFLTGNLRDEPSGAFNQAVVYQFDKLSCYSGGAINGISYKLIPGAPFTILPVSWGQNDDISTGMVLVSVSTAGGNTINYYRIYGNWCCSPHMTYQAISTTPYLPPSHAPQLGTSVPLDAGRGGCKALCGFFLNGIIHFVFSSANSTTYDDEINYNRLDVSALTNTSSSYDRTGYDCAYPAVASYGSSATDASVMIGFGCSNSNIYPEIDAISCDNAMSWSDPVLVKSSISYVNDGTATNDPPNNRYGDYTGMARYRTSLTTPFVWMNGMFADANNRWDTWITEIGGGLVSGVNNVTWSTGSKVYPNPITGSFSLEFSLNNDCSINITIADNTGRKVKELFNGKAERGDNVFSFDKSNLASGLYYLVIKSNSEIIKNEKIVIN